MRLITARIIKYSLRLLPLVLLVALFTGIIGPDTAKAAGWYNASWDYRKKITINAASGASSLTDFPVLISITADTGLGTHAQLDADDILFTADDEITKLSHEIEKYSSNGATANLTAWVKIPTLSNSTTTDIYMYYGNSGASSQQNAAAVWDTNYKMVQHLKEASGGANAVKDSTSNSNHGTDNNSPAFGATGKVDGAITFDAVNDLIQVADSNSLDLTNNITIEAWVNTNNNNAPYQTILEKRPSSTEYNYYMRLDNGFLRFSFYNATHIALLDSSTKLSQNAWHHVVATYNRSNIRLYVDGLQVASSAQTAAMVANTSALVTGIETYLVPDEKGFNGTIDELRISSTARSAGWIATSYSNQNNPSGFIALGAEQIGLSVTTIAATYVEETSATINGTLSWDGGEPCQYSFEWGTSSGSYTDNISWTGSIVTTDNFTTGLTGLSEGTKYYYRARAKNSAGIANGLEIFFSTKPLQPSAFTATANGTSAIDLAWTTGTGAEVTVVRGKLGSYPTSMSDGDAVYSGSGTSVTHGSLLPGTTYFYRAWAVSTDGPATISDTYASASAATLGFTLPVLTTNAASAVEETSANITGTLTSDGGEPCQYSFEWGTSPGSYTDNISWTGSLTTGQSFSTNLSGLAKGQKYYFRARAKNSAGIAYGAELDFLTKPDSPAALTATPDGSSKIDLTWTLGDGAGRTMVRGKIGSYPSSYTDGYEVYFSAGASVSDTGLSANTTYFYRAWSEKTGSQQWSNAFAQASATTAPAGPVSVGGKVFTVNKAIVLAPWLAALFAVLVVMILLIIHIRNNYFSHPGPGMFSKHLKALTGKRTAFTEKRDRNRS